GTLGLVPAALRLFFGVFPGAPRGFLRLVPAGFRDLLAMLPLLARRLDGVGLERVAALAHRAIFDVCRRQQRADDGPERNADPGDDQRFLTRELRDAAPRAAGRRHRVARRIAGAAVSLGPRLACATDHIACALIGRAGQIRSLV